MATPDDSDEILGTVTICREESPWQELAGHDEGEFRMLVAPAAREWGWARLVRLVLDRFRERRHRDRALQPAADDRRTPALRAARLRRTPERGWQPAPPSS